MAKVKPAKKMEAYIAKDRALTYMFEGVVMGRLGVDCTSGDTCTPTKTQLFIAELLELMILKGIFSSTEISKLLNLEYFEIAPIEK